MQHKEMLGECWRSVRRGNTMEGLWRLQGSLPDTVGGRVGSSWTMECGRYRSSESKANAPGPIIRDRRAWDTPRSWEGRSWQTEPKSKPQRSKYTEHLQRCRHWRLPHSPLCRSHTASVSGDIQCLCTCCVLGALPLFPGLPCMPTGCEGLKRAWKHQYVLEKEASQERKMMPRKTDPENYSEYEIHYPLKLR